MRAGDACVSRRKRAVVKRSALLGAIVASAVLAGCKEPQQAADSKISNSFVRAGQDVTILESRTYGTSDSVAQSNDEYYVLRFKWTNMLGYPVYPKLDHFVIEDGDKRRFLGVTSGAAALVGISNYGGTLDRGESHEYTVGFRVPVGTQGTLFYDASF